MLKLKVPDMSCGHCASTIEKAVKSVDPAARVIVDLGASTVAVETKANDATIRDVIKSAGYRQREIGGLKDIMRGRRGS
ncbi:heavy-metal-associated domain-containing protein [Mesorhizobium cantuariense]|uniref:Heavy-metal-associated domain-containing protein n=1 Tax=Mesorhizobium cantuariense TaxID=1300275 RepID=A0ABV7MSW6_9HYPH